jgi:hypothetical protein
MCVDRFLGRNLLTFFQWQTDTEQRLPNFPGNVSDLCSSSHQVTRQQARVCYPFGSGSVLLPLSSKNNYTPTVLFCGGSDIARNQDVTTKTPALAKCFRMTLDAAGIKAGWQTEDAPAPLM